MTTPITNAQWAQSMGLILAQFSAGRIDLDEAVSQLADLANSWTVGAITPTQLGVQLSQTLANWNNFVSGQLDWLTTSPGGGPHANGTVDITDYLGVITTIPGLQLLQQAMVRGDAGGVPYAFSVSTADADPGAGKLAFNSATVGSVTEVFIADHASSGSDMTAWITAMGAGTTAGSAGILSIQDAAGPTLAFLVTAAPTAAAGYQKVPVTYLAGALPAAGDRLVLVFAPTGNSGGTLRYGTGAPASGLGVIGDTYIDVATGDFYGPKTAGGSPWGSPTASALTGYVADAAASAADADASAVAAATSEGNAATDAAAAHADRLLADNDAAIAQTAAGLAISASTMIGTTTDLVALPSGLPSGFRSFRTTGFASAGDGGDVQWTRVNANPGLTGAAQIRLADRFLADGVTVDATNGGYCVMTDLYPKAEAFGWLPDGSVYTTPCTDIVAFINATGRQVQLYPKTYRTSVTLAPLCGGFDCPTAGFNETVSACILFTALGANPGFKTDGDNFKSPVRVRNVVFDCAAWTGPTACTADLLDLSGPVLADNVWVFRSPGNGWFFHCTAAGGGFAPYGSRLTNCHAYKCAGHGYLIGTGASLVNLVNSNAKWNGSPSYDTAPTAAGTKSGLKINRVGDGNPGSAYASLIIESARVDGGDFSYNAAYGIDIDLVFGASIKPGYAEGNLAQGPGGTRQHRIGLDFTGEFNPLQVANDTAGVFCDSIYKSGRENQIYIAVAGREIGALGPSTPHGYRMENIRQTLMSDLVSATVDVIPDNVAKTLTIMGFGGAAVVLGGSNAITADSNIHLPANWYMALQRWLQGSSIPTSGTYNSGDITVNYAPTLGSPILWRSIGGGSPGTQEAVGATGTSGHVLGYLDGNNTLSGNLTYSGTTTFNGAPTINATTTIQASLYVYSTTSHLFNPSTTSTAYVSFQIASNGFSKIQFQDGSQNSKWETGHNGSANSYSYSIFNTPLSATALTVAAADNGITTGAQLRLGGYIAIKQYTVATLPSAAGVGAGGEAMVTDATATTYGSTPAGGGANLVRVRVNAAATGWIIIG